MGLGYVLYIAFPASLQFPIPLKTLSDDLLGRQPLDSSIGLTLSSLFLPRLDSRSTRMVAPPKAAAPLGIDPSPSSEIIQRMSYAYEGFCERTWECARISMLDIGYMHLEILKLFTNPVILVFLLF
jgi:hypothetical protein